MKILIINYEFPPLGGGAATATQHIAKEMSAMNYEIVVLTTWYNGLKEDEVRDGYRIIRIRSLRKRISRSNPLEMISFVILALFHIPGILRIWRPDKIIAFFAIPSGIIAYALKMVYSINYIISLRGGDVPGFNVKNLNIYHWFSRPLTKRVWKNAEYIIANSNGLKKLAEQTAHKIRKKVYVIQNGVDLEQFNHNAPHEQNKITILFVGRLTEQKGISSLVEAVKKITNQCPELYNVFCCKIIGDGPLKNKLEESVKKNGLLDIIKFIGWLPREALPMYYQHANIFVLPSSDEGMSNAILEAMASGLPIITTNVSGNEDLVKNNENGIIINNDKELSSALITLIKDPELRKKFGQKSQKISEDYFWRKTALQYLQLINNNNDYRSI